MAKNDKPQRDHYREVTDRIVEALRQGTVPWRRPWEAGAMAAPCNAATGARYRGINRLVMLMHERTLETGDPRWCSYRQAAERGWQVRKGEKSLTVFFYRKVTKGSESEDGEDERAYYVMRSFPVFHASQMDGIPEWNPGGRQPEAWEAPDAAETIMLYSGADVRTGGSRAFYSPSGDYIQMPPALAFRSPEGWAATALHELAHWTGHPSRLARPLAARSDRESYAREELRAELASAYMCAETGIGAELENHASYVASWLKALEEDPREIFRAAADAEKIAGYCLAFHPAYAAARKEEEAAAPAPQDAADAAPAASMAA